MGNLTMTHETLLIMWNELRVNITNTAKNLTEDQLELSLNDTTIKGLLKHTVEAEFLFAKWYLGKEQPVEQGLSDNLADLIHLLELSHQHINEAVKSLTEEQLTTVVEGRMGSSTPIQAVSRLMYHAGMHAGQISFIKKIKDNS